MTQTATMNETGTEDLGEIARIFRPRRWEIGFFVFGTVAAVAILVLVVFQPFAKRGPFMAPVALAVAACGAAAAGCGLVFLFSWRERIVIHERGVVVQDWFRSKSIRWEDIDAVHFHLVKVYLGQEAWLVTRDGDKVQLPKLVVGQFVAFNLICKAIRERFLADWRQQFALGRTIDFGDSLSVDRDGILWNGRLLRWADAKKLQWGVQTFANGNKLAVRSVLTIAEPDGYEFVLTKSVPNFPMLLDWLESDRRIAVVRDTSFFK
jgi:hypothetical protein